MRLGKRGFGLIEVLLSLVLVGMVLGLVAKGYQTATRLNQASYRLSQKLEAATFLRRLSAGMSAATELDPLPNGVQIKKIDPKYNVTYMESFSRLPWPTSSSSADLDAGMITVDYILDTVDKTISRKVGLEVNVVLERVGAFTVTRDGRIADVELVSLDSGDGWSVRVHLPGVSP